MRKNHKIKAALFAGLAYLRWFQLIQEAGANTLRVYSVQNPSFYKAFYEYNSQHEEPLYLLQGIWVNDYIQNSRVDAYADSFAGKLLDNCLVTVDVIHGKRLIINNDADTSTGLYLHDISKWVLGYIIGNGWEDTTVAYTDEKYPDMEPYKGTYLTASKDASAFESLLAVFSRIRRGRAGVCQEISSGGAPSRQSPRKQCRDG